MIVTSFAISRSASPQFSARPISGDSQNFASPRRMRHARGDATLRARKRKTGTVPLGRLSGPRRCDRIGTIPSAQRAPPNGPSFSGVARDGECYRTATRQRSGPRPLQARVSRLSARPTSNSAESSWNLSAKERRTPRYLISNVSVLVSTSQCSGSCGSGRRYVVVTM